jgi:polyisoprenyl-phosphate glycosyltransferase
MKERITEGEIKISVIIPLFNEDAVIPHLMERMLPIVAQFPGSIEVLFVDDGSTDNTASQLFSICLQDPRFQYISFSRNFGHQLALSAGLMYARGTEAVFIMDADLQDPPELMETFYSKMQEGYDVVYGVRNDRKESGVKRFLYFSFYRMLNRISRLHFPLDSGDFCLISRKAVDIINQFPEENRFLRGIRTWIGFSQVGVPYERSARVSGKTHYSYKKLWQLAMSGIYNFSEFPVRFISVIGFFSVLLSLLYLAATLINKFIYHSVPAGFTALLFTIILFSGVQLLSLGVIGEYVIRIFMQVKGRPFYIVDKKIFDKKLTHGK